MWESLARPSLAPLAALQGRVHGARVHRSSRIGIKRHVVSAAAIALPLPFWPASTAPVQPAVAPPAAPPCGDALMEASRPELRSVFTIEDWEALRSTNRYFTHMTSIFQSRVLLGMVKPLAYVLAVCVAACAYGAAQQAGLLPAFLPALGAGLRELFNLTSFALSLLLVFRTNSSYGRWDEACKLWTQAANRTRDLCRLGLTWIPEEKRELRAALCRWAPAFMKATLCHLRSGEDVRKELEGILLPHEVEAVARAQHRPSFVLHTLFRLVHDAGLPSRIALKMQDHLAALEDCVGGCERILTTSVPINYTRHTSRFLVTWLTALPFALHPGCGLTTIPLVMLISFLLLGIDKIGVSIEEPFSILPLEAVADATVAATSELAATHDRPPAAQRPVNSFRCSCCREGFHTPPLILPASMLPPLSGKLTGPQLVVSNIVSSNIVGTSFFRTLADMAIGLPAAQPAGHASRAARAC